MEKEKVTAEIKIEVQIKLDQNGKTDTHESEAGMHA